MNKTLSLKVPTELQWYLPKLARMRVYGTLAQIKTVEGEFRTAEWHLEKRLRREEEERERLRRECQEQLRKQRERSSWRTQELFNQRFHQTREFQEEPMPAHSSQKGWRRNLSELPRRGLGLFFLDWGMIRQGHRDKKRNRGQKPRKPWFK